MGSDLDKLDEKSHFLAKTLSWTSPKNLFSTFLGIFQIPAPFCLCRCCATFFEAAASEAGLNDDNVDDDANDDDDDDDDSNVEAENEESESTN